MMNLPQPFLVPVLISGKIQQALLICVDQEGNVLVDIDDVRYHCIVGPRKILTLGERAEEKYLSQTAVEGISYLPGKE